jgi:hypothetical protein
LEILPGKNDFLRALGGDHVAMFVEAGPTLVVCFENLDKVDESKMNRIPWRYSFVNSEGHSFLGLMADERVTP